MLDASAVAADTMETNMIEVSLGEIAGLLLVILPFFILIVPELVKKKRRP
jgi:hypothetical protein